MPPMRMMHNTDPAEELRASVGDLSHIEVFNNQVLVAIYKRPERTKSGIILADVTREEDKWQGKIGLVLKKGPMAFVDDDRVSFHGQNVKEGDWVAYRVSDGWQLAFNKVDCRMLEDTQIKMRVSAPDLVW